MRVLIMVAMIGLSGCSTMQQKAEAYRHAAERFGYPDKIKVCYERKGDIARGAEYRCFGEGCELPSCPAGASDGIE